MLVKQSPDLVILKDSCNSVLINKIYEWFIIKQNCWFCTTLTTTSAKTMTITIIRLWDSVRCFWSNNELGNINTRMNFELVCTILSLVGAPPLIWELISYGGQSWKCTYYRVQHLLIKECLWHTCFIPWFLFSVTEYILAFKMIMFNV